MKLNLLFLLFLSCCSVHAQSLLLVENFDYPPNVEIRNFGWTPHSGANNNPLRTSTFGLSLGTTPYFGNNIGNAVLVDNTGSDENKPLSAWVDSGSVYASFLVKANGTVTTDGSGFFFHFAQYSDVSNPVFTAVSTAFRARTFIATGSTPAHFRLGLTFNAAAVPATVGTDLTNDLDTSKTYLVVVKYTFVPGPDNDEVSLYVFDDGDSISTEPANPTIGPLTGTAADAQAIQGVALRQYNADQNIVVDGIYVRTEWLLEQSNVSVAEQNAAAALRVYPNPYSGGTLFIQGTDEHPVQVELLNLNGQKLFETQLLGNDLQLPDQPTGLYLLKLQHKGNLSMHKLLIR